MAEVHELVGRMARGLSTARARDVERQLLAGQNRVEVVDEFAGIVIGRVVYEVPRWCEHPVNRAKIAWRRWRFRHGA
jgi:hypothetical protein